nr:hypothetical protein [Bdellovibrionales bacterium]
ADLSREIFHIAREIDAEGEPLLRRRLEMFGNQVSAVISQDFAEPTPRVLKLVDQIESELVEWGY